mgnify:CR=1 FL=1
MSFESRTQYLLNLLGASLSVDGVPGPKTIAALEAEITKQQIKQTPAAETTSPVVSPVSGVAPVYPKPLVIAGVNVHPRFETKLPKPYTHLHPFDVMRAYVGQKEIKGDKDNVLIAHFHEHSSNLGSHSNTNDYHDEVPHCASAINWVADMSGCKKTGSAAAASYSDYGNPRQGDWVEVGDIIHKRTGTQNHVTLCNKRFNRRTDKTYEGCGSNQNDAINVSTYKVSDIKSVQMWKTLPGTVLAPIGILGNKPIPSSGVGGSTV